MPDKFWLNSTISTEFTQPVSMEGCCQKTVKYLVIGFSLLLGLVGLAIIGLGTYILLETNNYLHFLPNDYLNTSYFLISLGVIICVISLVGFIGSFKKSRCFISSFTTILILVLIAEFFGGFASCIIKDDVRKVIQVNMEESLSDYSLNSSLAWDSLHTNYSCCGVTGREDWGGDVPSSCCFPNVTVVHDCGKAVNNTFTTGCLDVFVEEFLPVINLIPGDTMPDITLVTGLTVALACLQLFGLLFGCCYGMCIGDKDSQC